MAKGAVEFTGPKSFPTKRGSREPVWVDRGLRANKFVHQASASSLGHSLGSLASQSSRRLDIDAPLLWNDKKRRLLLAPASSADHHSPPLSLSLTQNARCCRLGLCGRGAVPFACALTVSNNARCGPTYGLTC